MSFTRTKYDTCKLYKDCNKNNNFKNYNCHVPREYCKDLLNKNNISIENDLKGLTNNDPTCSLNKQPTSSVNICDKQLIPEYERNLTFKKENHMGDHMFMGYPIEASDNLWTVGFHSNKVNNGEYGFDTCKDLCNPINGKCILSSNNLQRIIGKNTQSDSKDSYDFRLCKCD